MTDSQLIARAHLALRTIDASDTSRPPLQRDLGVVSSAIDDIEAAYPDLRNDDYCPECYGVGQGRADGASCVVCGGSERGA